jgi:hypothetical protein
MAHYNKEHIKPKLWHTMLKTLEQQMNCLSNNEIRFIAHEGFAKLLLNKVISNNVILSKLLIAYVTVGDENKKLKSCLYSFFGLYAKMDVTNLCRIVFPTIQGYLTQYPNKIEVAKSISSLIYFLTGGVKNVRQRIIHLIVKEMSNKINDYSAQQRWIEILLEFKIHYNNIEIDDKNKTVCMESEERLLKIYNRLKKIWVNDQFI